jgi:hypothetical protein
MKSRILILVAMLFSVTLLGATANDTVIAPKKDGGNVIVVSGANLIADSIVTNFTLSACTIASGTTVAIGGRCSVYFTTLTHSVSSMTFTADEGQQITWVVTSTSGRTIAFPSGTKWRFGTSMGTLVANTYNIYSLVKVNGVLFVAAMDQMQ